MRFLCYLNPLNSICESISGIKYVFGVRIRVNNFVSRVVSNIDPCIFGCLCPPHDRHLSIQCQLWLKISKSFGTRPDSIGILVSHLPMAKNISLDLLLLLSGLIELRNMPRPYECLCICSCTRFSQCTQKLFLTRNPEQCQEL
ncbi:unnamed protein product [Moneuplotes crassus]|uniref:Uncharacterized protein n=1 Tax=Euplotes crassus TaxID=5936 RepID=A0AAD1U969_EUPCR|nr:unnamed protein product [Moneuplotes crassus]